MYTIGSTKWMTLANSLLVYLINLWSTRFKKWFFGHYHDNKNVNAEEILLYEQVIRIS